MLKKIEQDPRVERIEKIGNYLSVVLKPSYSFWRQNSGVKDFLFREESEEDLKGIEKLLKEEVFRDSVAGIKATLQA